MILGLAGSFGAGKGAVVEYLQSKGFLHYSASGFITEEIEKRNMPVTRDSMILVGNDLRQKHGPAYIVEALYNRALAHEGNAIIESLRAVAEVEKIKELGGVVIGVDADPKLRYERSQQRGSVKDGVSFDKWASQEQQEMNPDDPTKQDIFGALKKADIVVFNNTTFDELYAQIDEALVKIGL
jgi:dephospho-CoA kinase